MFINIYRKKIGLHEHSRITTVEDNVYLTVFTFQILVGVKRQWLFCQIEQWGFPWRQHKRWRQGKVVVQFVYGCA